MPASCIARKDNSTSLRVAVTSDLPSLFPMPNSMLSNLLMYLRKVPLGDGVELYERPGHKDRNPWESALTLRKRTRYHRVSPPGMIHTRRVDSTEKSNRNCSPSCPGDERRWVTGWRCQPLRCVRIQTKQLGRRKETYNGDGIRGMKRRRGGGYKHRSGCGGRVEGCGRRRGI